MTLQLNPEGPDLSEDVKAGDIISDSMWNGQWSSESPEEKASAKTQENLGKIARAQKGSKNAR